VPQGFSCLRVPFGKLSNCPPANYSHEPRFPKRELRVKPFGRAGQSCDLRTLCLHLALPSLGSPGKFRESRPFETLSHRLDVYYTCMAKKLTISVSDEVYQGLYAVIGRRRISRFLEDLARPHVTRKDLEAEYLAMARDEAREREAGEWCEAVVGDVADEPR